MEIQAVNTEEQSFNYHFFLKKMYIVEQIFMDVFSRFYHQLSFQGNFVLKDFYKDKIELSASIIDAIIESILQRIPLTKTEERKLLDEIYDAWHKSDCYGKLDRRSSSLEDKCDPIHDVKTVAMIIRCLVDIAASKITDKEFEKAEEVKLEKNLGDYAPVFLNPAKPPFNVYTEQVPSM